MPAADRVGDGIFGAVGQVAGGAPPLEDGLERATHADEENGQAVEAPGAVGEDAARGGVRIVVADVDHRV